MAWAKTTKEVIGDSNHALATGLYGYEFAQAAEIVRDSGFLEEDYLKSGCLKFGILNVSNS